MLASSKRAVSLLQRTLTRAACTPSREGSAGGEPGGDHVKADEFFDVVVVGGGMAARAMALSLGKSSQVAPGGRVLLLDPTASGSRSLAMVPKDGSFSNRVSLLTSGSVKLLTDLGVWKYISGEARVQPVTDIQVWDACSDSRVTFDAQALSREEEEEEEGGKQGRERGEEDILSSSYKRSSSEGGVVGYVVENRAIGGGLDVGLEGEGGGRVERMEGELVTIHGRSAKDLFVQMETNKGTRIKTKLLVGADGAMSKVREQSGLAQLSCSAVSLLVATLHLEQVSSNTTVWQRFLPSGPIHLLPLSADRSSLVWVMGEEEARSLVAATEEKFVDSVNTALFEESPKSELVSYAGQLVKNTIASVAPDALPVQQLPPTVCGVDRTSRTSFPLQFTLTPRLAKNRVALIGDAAHPLAGYGVNLSFGDIAVLTSCLEEASERGEELGVIPPLLQYESLRQQYIVPAMLGAEGLRNLFSTSWTPVVALRSLGMHTTAALPPIRNFIMSLWQQNTH